MIWKRGEVVLVGVPWSRRTEFRANSIHGNYQASLEGLAAGAIEVQGLFEAVDPGAAQQAYQDLRHQRGAYLSKVFRWGQQQA